MKRVFALAILVHWMMFFALHAIGAVSGTFNPAIFHGITLFEGLGPARALPLIAAGLGSACALAAILFGWAALEAVHTGPEAQNNRFEIERAAFGSSVVLFSLMCLTAIVQSDPRLLVSATTYFAAMLVSWAAASVEWEIIMSNAAKRDATRASRHARAKAGDAVFHLNLTRISGRERKL
jgi:glycerol uptake facilitator-like aquaporin